MENTPQRKRGPAPKYGEKVERYSISITPAQADRLKQLGDGNLSQGIRRALALSLHAIPEQ